MRLASSTLTRVATYAAALPLLLAACTSQETVEGRALDRTGTQSSGVVGNEHVKVGQTWWFALPLLRNTSAHPIEITDVSLVEVPKGIQVLEYRAYNRSDSEGLPLLVEQGDRFAPDFNGMKNYAKAPVRVAAGTESEIYYIAKIKITAPPSSSARYCRFSYRQNGQAYAQTLDCEVELTAG